MRKYTSVRLAFFLSICTLICLAAECSAAPSSLASAETALQLIKEGETRVSARTIRQALNADPSNPLIHQVSGTLLLLSGDLIGASAEWKIAESILPNDSLNRYARGIINLAQGNRPKALQLFQSAEPGGNRASCLLAERYVEFLNGAVGSGSGLPLPDIYSASIRGLSGMTAEREGDHVRALGALTAALDEMPGDKFSEPFSPIMTYELETPLRFGLPTIPVAQANAKVNDSASAACSGVVSIAPDYVDTDTGYVVFKIDGALNSLANTPPYRLVLDTTRFANGIHHIEIILYSRDGQVISRVNKEIKTSNVAAAAPKDMDSSLIGRIHDAIWQLLILRPSRLSLAYAAAGAARAAGNTDQTKKYLEIAASLDPNYRDTRVRYAALPGNLAFNSFWRGAPSEKLVAITFDDGPKPGITEQLLQILARERVPATFFLIGRHTTAFPELTRQISQAGMEVECHTYTHPNLCRIPSADVERELMRTVASIRAATGRTPKYFRPPGGNLNPVVIKIAARWGLTPCMWTVDGETMEKTTADRLLDWMLPRIVPGSILLLHNGRMTTVDALPYLISGLRKKGYTFVTIEQLANRTIGQFRLTGAR